MPAVGDLRRLGRPAHQGHDAVERGVGALPGPLRRRSGARAKQVTSLIEEFQYPKHGPGMMWERCRELVEAAGLQGRLRDAGHDDPPRGRARHRRGGRGRRRHHRVRRRPRHLVDAVHRCCSRPWTRRSPAEVQAAADDLRVPRLPVGRAGRPGRQGGVDRQLDLHPRPRGQDHAGAELRLVVAVHGEGRPQRARPRVHGRTRATSGGRPPTTSSSRRARPSSRRSGSCSAADVEAGLRGADAEGVSRVRRRLPGTTSRCCAAGSTANAPNVHPVGRNGMHRYNNQDHSMYTAMLTVENILAAPTTTSGPSTSRRSTTRRATTPRPWPPRPRPAGPRGRGATRPILPRKPKA